MGRRATFRVHCGIMKRLMRDNSGLVLAGTCKNYATEMGYLKKMKLLISENKNEEGIITRMEVMCIILRSVTNSNGIKYIVLPRDKINLITPERLSEYPIYSTESQTHTGLSISRAITQLVKERCRKFKENYPYWTEMTEHILETRTISEEILNRYNRNIIEIFVTRKTLLSEIFAPPSKDSRNNRLQLYPLTDKLIEVGWTPETANPVMTRKE